VGDRAVVCDPVDEGPLTAVAAEGGQGLPEGEPDVLQEILALGRLALVGGDQPGKRSPVLFQQLLEACFEAG
jgi:hypothetical protein